MGRERTAVRGQQIEIIDVRAQADAATGTSTLDGHTIATGSSAASASTSATLRGCDAPGRDVIEKPEASKSQRLGRASGGGLPDPADLTPARPSAPAAPPAGGAPARRAGGARP